MKLIGGYLQAGVEVEGTIRPTRAGVPQGSPLSPLLSNIVLDMLDKELEKRGHRFARYADDVVILVRSRRAGKRVMESITRFLERKLKLKVNQKKSRVVSANEVVFLGFVFRRGKKLGRRSSSSSKCGRTVSVCTRRSATSVRQTTRRGC